MRGILRNVNFLLNRERTSLDRAADTHLALGKITEIHFLMVNGPHAYFDLDCDFGALGDVAFEGAADLNGVFSPARKQISYRFLKRILSFGGHLGFGSVLLGWVWCQGQGIDIEDVGGGAACLVGEHGCDPVNTLLHSLIEFEKGWGGHDAGRGDEEKGGCEFHFERLRFVTKVLGRLELRMEFDDG
jgi:hypothetical protein